MRVEFGKSAVKFIKKIDSVQQYRIKEKILLLKTSLEQRQAMPFDELDIKKLKGNWQGFFRIRVGKIRIIFIVYLDAEKIYVHDICFRGDVYD